jgi:hypothetical protein
MQSQSGRCDLQRLILSKMTIGIAKMHTDTELEAYKVASCTDERPGLLWNDRPPCHFPLPQIRDSYELVALLPEFRSHKQSFGQYRTCDGTWILCLVPDLFCLNSYSFGRRFGTDA